MTYRSEGVTVQTVSVVVTFYPTLSNWNLHKTILVTQRSGNRAEVNSQVGLESKSGA